MECIVHGVAKSWTQLSEFHLSLEKKDITHVSSPTKAEREREGGERGVRQAERDEY